jgi:hypothetical protein
VSIVGFVRPVALSLVSQDELAGVVLPYGVDRIISATLWKIPSHQVNNV